MKRLKVGIIGFGRSGRDNQARCFAAMPDKFEIAAVVEQVVDWRNYAGSTYGCEVFSDYTALYEKKGLDLIVNTLPSHLHVPVSLEFLKRGFNVVCDKPLAKTVAEVDLLAAEAERTGSVLTVFQQMHYLPFMQKVREIVNSGVLGRIIQISCQDSTFARRWDWQTLQEFYGGNLMNGCSHALEHVLEFFGTDIMPEVRCYTDRVNTLGDAEDYVKMLFSAPSKPVVDLEVSSCCTYPGSAINIQGNCGGIKGSDEHVEWKYFLPSEAPVQQLVRKPLASKDGKPAYCWESLKWYEGSWDLPEEEKDIFQVAAMEFYERFYKAYIDGTPPEIAIKAIRLQTAII
jgi:predicted dehydrogenase